MANQTVYPYGTGGSLPSGIAIVNDFTTGGADKALAAEAGKTLYGELFDPANDTYTKSDATPYYVDGNGNDVSSNPVRIRVVFPVLAGDVVHAECSLGKGVAASVYDTVANAKKAQQNYLQTLSYSYVPSVSGTITQDGYLVVSLGKEGDSTFSSGDIEDYLDSLVFTVVRSDGTKGAIVDLNERVEALEENGGHSATTIGNDSFNLWNKTVILLNPYKDKPQNAYKGQMHCHTNNSDGADSPETVVGKYIAAGYDFMTITDHNYITQNPNVSGIVWLCDSYEDTNNSAGYQHMNVYNAQEVYNVQSMTQTGNTPQMIVDHFVKQGNSVVSYNHPEFPPVYASDSALAALPKGISFIEVFNGTIQTLIGTVENTNQLPSEAYYGDMYDCTGNGLRYKNTSNNYSSPTWTPTNPVSQPDGNLDRGFRIMLDNGHKVFCNAVDDYHSGNNMFDVGWVVAFANEKTQRSIWNALLSGCSYASSGITLSDIRVKDGVFSLQISNGSEAVTTFYGEGNTVLATVNGSNPSYQITGTEKYIRAMVSIGRKRAWSQPIWVIGVKNQYDY